MDHDGGSDSRAGGLSGKRTIALAGAGVAMLVAAGLAARRIVTPRERPPEVADLVDSDSEFYTVNGLRVHVKRAGEGSPVLVLLHGFGASVFSWRKVMGPLAERFTVVAYDRPAFGLTDRPLSGEWDPEVWSGGSPYGPEAQVEILARILEALGVERAVLVGNSMGGAVAALVAARRPERVQALVLVDAYLDGAGPPTVLREAMRSPIGRRVGPTMLSPMAAGLGPGLRSLVADPATVTAEMVEGYARPLRLPRARAALWELTAAGMIHVSEAELGRITAPTLVLRGETDRLVTAAAAQRAAGLIPGATLQFIPGAGHVPQEEQPTLFIQAIAEFLSRLP
jgi:pimeloyl-ACP methyl ester carboxylesterase